MATLVGLPSGHMQINVVDSALASAEINAAHAHIVTPSMKRAYVIDLPSAFSRAQTYTAILPRLEASGDRGPCGETAAGNRHLSRATPRVTAESHLIARGISIYFAMQSEQGS
jgi:hypothetical protein